MVFWRSEDKTLIISRQKSRWRRWRQWRIIRSFRPLTNYCRWTPSILTAPLLTLVWVAIIVFSLDQTKRVLLNSLGYEKNKRKKNKIQTTKIIIFLLIKHFNCFESFIIFAVIKILNNFKGKDFINEKLH